MTSSTSIRYASTWTFTKADREATALHRLVRAQPKPCYSHLRLHLEESPASASSAQSCNHLISPLTCHRSCTCQPQKRHHTIPTLPATCSRPTESVEALVGIPDEGQRQRALLTLSRPMHIGFRLRAQLSRVIDLRDLVDGEVLRVDIALQLRLERRSDFAEAVPLHALEERVLLELCSAMHTSDAI